MFEKPLEKRDRWRDCAREHFAEPFIARGRHVVRQQATKPSRHFDVVAG